MDENEKGRKFKELQAKKQEFDRKAEHARQELDSKAEHAKQSLNAGAQNLKNEKEHPPRLHRPRIRRRKHLPILKNSPARHRVRGCETIWKLFAL